MEVPIGGVATVTVLATLQNLFDFVYSTINLQRDSSYDWR